MQDDQPQEDSDEIIETEKEAVEAAEKGDMKGALATFDKVGMIEYFE